MLGPLQSHEPPHGFDADPRGAPADGPPGGGAPGPDDPHDPGDPTNPPAPEGPGRGLFEVFDALMLMTIGLVLVIAYYVLQWKVESALGSLYAAVLTSCGLALVAAPWALASATGESPLHTFRLLRLPPRQMAWLTLLAVALVMPVEYLGTLTSHVIKVPAEVEAQRAQLVPGSGLEWALAALALCVVVPLGEETVFRGLLQQAARGPLGGSTAAVMCGLLFAGLHFQPWYLGGYVLLGITLGMALETTGSLWAPLWLHAIYNAVALVALAIDPLGEGEPLTSGTLGPPLVLASAVVAAWAWRALRRSHPWDEDENHVDARA